MENIDDFNRGVGLILGKLYQDFPVPILMRMRDLEGFEDVNHDPTRRVRRMLVYSATMHFLQNEGFLRFTSTIGAKEDDAFADITLTSKGLSALSKTPNSLSQPYGKTVGDLLVDISSDLLKKGSWEGLVTIVRSMLGA
ncbi:MAG: hypothetical protein ABT940_10255 [Alphaproteobacteria bacterium]